MWPRICEALIALWLLASPWVMRGTKTDNLVAWVAAVLMLVFSLAALAERFRRAYFGTLIVSLAIAAYPFLYQPPASPMKQNILIVGLVVAMFAIMPPDAMRPPREWRELEHE